MRKPILGAILGATLEIGGKPHRTPGGSFQPELYERLFRRERENDLQNQINPGWFVPRAPGSCRKPASDLEMIETTYIWKH